LRKADGQVTSHLTIRPASGEVIYSADGSTEYTAADAGSDTPLRIGAKQSLRIISSGVAWHIV